MAIRVSEVAVPPRVRRRGGPFTRRLGTVRRNGQHGNLAQALMNANDSPSELSPDVAIGRRLSAGDPDAIGALYDLLGGTIWSMARRAFPAAVAEEVVQDVLLRIWTRREQFHEDRGSLTAWVLRAARNRITDVIRSQSARPKLDPWDTAIDGRAVDSSQASAWEHLWLSEQRRALRSGIERLAEPERDVIWLAYFGLTQSEIAERLSVPLGTVKTRTRAALAKLRDRLAAADTRASA